jgi:hypothetical protein
MMQVLRSVEQLYVAPVGLNVRVMLVSGDDARQQIVSRLAQLGGAIDSNSDLFTGLEAVIEDPVGYGLLVVDCDHIGGLEAGLRAQKLLGTAIHRVPVILVSSECTTQSFPEESGQPVVLRAPATTLSMRMGFEHALRHRYPLRFA